MKQTTITGTIIKWFVVLIAVILLVNFATTAIGQITDWPWPRDNVVDAEGTEEGITTKTNGGQTPEEIEAAKNDDNSPYGDDVFRNYFVKDYRTHVVMFRQSIDEGGNAIFPNISFVKTSKGLIWDGAIGVSVKLKTNFWTGWHDFENPDWTFNFKLIGYDANLKPIWQKIALQGLLTLPVLGPLSGPLQVLGLSGAVWSDTENIVTFSDFNPNFAPDFYACWGGALMTMNKKSEINQLQTITKNTLIARVLSPFFQELTDNDAEKTEMIMGSGSTQKQIDDSTMAKLNSFATFLWNQSKSTDLTARTSIVDISSYFVKLIPEAQQQNYPIPENKRQHYSFENYRTYICNIVANVSYSYSSVSISRDPTKIEKNATQKHDVAPPPTEYEQFAQLQLSLVNSNNSDISQFNIVSKPIRITIGSRVVLWNKPGEINAVKSIAVPASQTLNFSIQSEGLVFNTLNGTINIIAPSQSKTFEYTYLHDYINVSVGLLPISSMDLSAVNLALNPVVITIVGNNNEGTFNFVFNTNQKLSNPQNLPVKIGTYSYAITSNQLLFTDYTGTVEFNTEIRSQNFTFYINNEAPLYVGTGFDAPSGYFVLRFASQNIFNQIKSDLGGEYVRINLDIFDINDVLIKSTFTTMYQNNSFYYNALAKGLTSQSIKYRVSVRSPNGQIVLVSSIKSTYYNTSSSGIELIIG